MEGRRILLDEEPDFTGFARNLASEGFAGDVTDGVAQRLLAATDNSIYQVRPALVLHPKLGPDLNAAVRAACRTPGPAVALTARGGGTGTNGQSLTRGVVVDISRHMNRILRLDAEARLVTVEPGVVLDQLNAALAPYGLFFPPSVSTASRATLGGMVATDASGKGSRIYGKTSAWIEALDIVLSDGNDWTVRAMPIAEAEAIALRPDLVGAIHRTVLDIVRDKAETIARVFPGLNRSLTGYNLEGVIRPDGLFDLSFLLAGSEGTLAITKSITLRLAPQPKLKALVVARYASFDTALRDVQNLLAAEPSAIEVLDDKVLALASQDILWTGIEGVLGGRASEPVMGLNFIEFVAEDEATLTASLAAAQALLAASPHRAMDWKLLRDAGTIRRLWQLREKSVGLLGRLDGKRQGTAFVEDTAVPPERLADYVADFRSILDRHELRYGMFGHADVGCLHVRPALDMTDPADARMIRLLSDEIASLTKSYDGLLWGEHGRGFRGEYSPLFFGPELYPALEAIKAAFDPADMFNPGKLASPNGTGRVDPIDGVPLRGEADRAIDAERAAAFDRALACNGNAACHSWALSEPMCPSYKATRDRVQSPKGRAVLLREWARLSSERDRGSPVAPELETVAAALKTSLDTCLSCQACTSQCPVKVDVPTMRSRFLADYYRTRSRPLRDRLMGRMELALPLARRFPRLANALLSAAPVRRGIGRHLGLVDLPALRPARDIRRTSASSFARKVVLLRDSFTASFDGAVHEAAVGVLERLDYEVISSPVWRNGKPEHVLGFSDRFARKAERAQIMRERLGADGVPLVSLDAATGLLFEREYQACAPRSEAPRVQAIEAFLAKALDEGGLTEAQGASESEFRLHLHCTERTARPETGATWLKVLAHFGLKASVPSLGCCGMAGMFGHEAEHAALSRTIFDQSWIPALAEHTPGMILATGFSCRCQTKRFAGFRPAHPIEAIATRLGVRAP
ncbi:FAD-binding and (Fe-S)-binding domain-containing protein [Aureimonas psammosilenae]|uniref:FAD-binding and (Fe-S)-binding domain-containing protein n=1 Tax=Aureimonas psammosilenae TaxID=2495496 RepID=UPI0012607E62|nr:FAD-binding and (Fe-S)-binding domain-containing protein [Aureimonas psammosilenae]